MLMDIGIKELLFSPVTVFFAVCAAIFIFAAVLSKFSAEGTLSEKGLDSYACGQQGMEGYVNPGYSQFFTYAFIFTVMHVLTMVVATAPKDRAALPIVYVLAGIYVIFIVLKR